MSNSNHYDVIIIGTGAGGGTLAYKLAPTGKRILLLERGDYVPREQANWNHKAVVLDGRYKAHDVWRDSEGREFHPSTHYRVGGNTKFYGAALLRMRNKDFGELRHHDGISPAWPLRYEDLQPYYLQAEQLYQVHGNRGEDFTEPQETEPYAFPAVSHEPRIQQLHDDLEKLGYRPFHLPIGIMLNEQNPRKSPCIRCDSCDGFPCLVNAKADAQVVCVDPALEYANVTLLTNATVTRLDTDASGQTVNAVRVERNGEPETYSADIVVVACGAVNSAALLLRSASDQHPNGLANRSDVVGRHYMCHNNSTLLAISVTPNPTVFQKTIALNDFYFGADDFDYPLGHISMVGKLDADILRAGAPKFAPHLALEQLGKHSIDFWLTTEDLPNPDNRVQVNRDSQIHLHYTPNNVEAHNRLTSKLKSLLHAVGMEDHLMHNTLYLGKKIPLAGVAHQCGTVRFGADPDRSALDVNCKAHDLDNLYVVDGSFFPSSSSCNPALTIMANALRVGDHLIQRLH